MNLSVRKWFVGTPATEAKKRKKAAPKARKKTAKAQKAAHVLPAVEELSKLIPATTSESQEDLGPVVEGSEEHSRDLSDVSNPDAVSIVGTDDSDDSDGEPLPKKMKNFPRVTAYIDIVSPARSTKTKETTITHGPFFFTTETTHCEFLQLVATCASDSNHIFPVASINQGQLLWKLNVPANDKKKPLSNEQGYQALIAILTNWLMEKSKDSTITLIMPPLLKNVHVSDPLLFTVLSNVCLGKRISS